MAATSVAARTKAATAGVFFSSLSGVRTEDLSQHDLAAITTQLAHGRSEAMAQGMVDMMIAKEAGLDNAESRTPAAATPTTFRRWCEEVLEPAVLGV